MEISGGKNLGITEERTNFRLKYSCKFPGTTKYYVNAASDQNYRNKHFFKFPRECKKEQLKQWKQVCRIVDTVPCDNFRLCEDNFLEKDFVNFRRERLNYEVIPKNLQLVVQCESEHEESGTVSSGDCSDMAGEAAKFPWDMDNGQYDFLSTPIEGSHDNVGVMGSGVPKSDLSPQKSKMYKLKCLKKLYDENKFQFIEESLNEVTKNFINSQLRNAAKAPSAKRWSVEDKVFALSIYKRGPRLYRYLATHFHLPSPRLLKSLLSKIPFGTGLNTAVMEVLKAEVSKMYEHDKYCALLFDEM
ncbi:hypothetical protein J437_LFUL015122 [Ladona fulva]|uniref:THAP-type domain-containing protein n=1 Tax=Ladona fulva TaxID=123851 RepID=A0A8K0KDT0_LADFU|nr:hypothetical protein J437_LFUL015122 [Ladona fulva]